MRVGVRWCVVEAVAVGELDEMTEVHHGDAVRDVAHHRQVVGDHQVGEPQPVLQVLEQVDDLRLHGHVERGHRLVEDDELRLERERTCDTDALPLATGELVRVAVAVLGGEPHGGEQLVDTRQRLGASDAVDEQRLRDDVAHRHAGVERGERVLEHDLHRTA